MTMVSVGSDRIEEEVEGGRWKEISNFVMLPRIPVSKLQGVYCTKLMCVAGLAVVNRKLLMLLTIVEYDDNQLIVVSIISLCIVRTVQYCILCAKK